MKKQTSLAKVASNRKNAKLSTGPKTSKGKSVVKWNALKCGLLAKEVVIEQGDGRESRSEFQSLNEALVEDLKPVGAMEEILVEKIVVCYWRLRRVVRCEMGEIHEAIDTYDLDISIQRADAVSHMLKWPSANGQGCEKLLMMSTAGIKKLQQMIEGLSYDIKEYGSFSERAEKEMLSVLGRNEGDCGRDLFFYNWLASEEGQVLAAAELESDKVSLSADQCRNINLEMLAQKKRLYKLALDAIQECEDLRKESYMAKSCIPGNDSSDKILRYETAIERQMYRAMNQLERLQRQRFGEYTPPPINVELAGQG